MKCSTLWRPVAALAVGLRLMSAARPKYLHYAVRKAARRRPFFTQLLETGIQDSGSISPGRQVWFQYGSRGP
jgi:hypothetical protein